MRVGLIDADRTSWRNLHLMRRSAWHKAQGDEVIFPYDGTQRVDKVIISSVFTYKRPNVFKWLEVLGVNVTEQDPIFVSMELPEWVEVGGTGWNIHAKASPEVEATKPDYALYDALLGPANYGQGFTSRGCPRGCHFCVVPEMNGNQVQEVATLDDIRNSDYRFIKLMDDNFWANSPTNPWRDRMKEAIDKKYELSFTQGLDIRFVDEERAHLLHRVSFWNEGHTAKQVTFAFDSPKIEKQYRRGFELLIQAGIKPYQIASFVLMGFESTPEEDDHRLQVLRELGADPFAMVYIPIHGETVPDFYRNNHDVLKCYGEHLTVEQQYRRHWEVCKDKQRWSNKKELFKSITFEEYEPYRKRLATWAAQDQQPLLFEVIRATRKQGRPQVPKVDIPITSEQLRLLD